MRVINCRDSNLLFADELAVELDFNRIINGN